MWTKLFGHKSSHKDKKSRKKVGKFYTQTLIKRNWENLHRNSFKIMIEKLGKFTHKLLFKEIKNSNYIEIRERKRERERELLIITC